MVIIKVSFRYLGKYWLSCMYQELNLSLHMMHTLVPLINALLYTFCKPMINEFYHKVILNYGMSNEYFF
jgi:hypothetical protein